MITILSQCLARLLQLTESNNDITFAILNEYRMSTEYALIIKYTEIITYAEIKRTPENRVFVIQ